MRPRTLLAAFLLAASAQGAAATEPLPLSPEQLDRITAGAGAAAELAVGNGAWPQVQPEPPRRLRDLAPWLRRQIGCALPGRVCTQG